MEFRTTLHAIMAGKDVDLLTDTRALSDFVEQALEEKQPDMYRKALAQFDRLLVGKAMKHAEGLQIRAAELLGISRPTLRASFAV